MTGEPRLRAAISRADITPPVGVQMCGFAARGRNTGYHDPLTATALVLARGRTRAAIVACDLIYVNTEIVERVEAEVAHRCGIHPGHLLLCCSHTHYGPPLPPGPEDATAEMLRDYWTHLIHVLAGLVADAASRTVPVSVGVASGSCEIAVNRRERRPDGTIILGRNHQAFADREVLVARLDDETGKPLAVLVNAACHGVCLSSRWTLFSADFPGAMRSQLEPATGATALFIQGATGNQNPLAMGHDYAHAATTGERLAIEAQRLWESIVPVRAKALAVSRTQVELPGIRYGSRENAARLLDASRRELEQLTSRDGTQPAHRRWLERLVERAEAALRSWDTAEQPPRVVASVGAVQFGPVALVAAAGEIFAEVGSEVKAKAPTPHTLFAAYTNGDVGYVPTPEAYPEGGYEVERACRVDPEAAPLITEACLDVLRRVRT